MNQHDFDLDGVAIQLRLWDRVSCFDDQTITVFFSYVRLFWGFRLQGGAEDVSAEDCDRFARSAAAFIVFDVTKLVAWKIVHAS